jgi:hypothetical protein
MEAKLFPSPAEPLSRPARFTLDPEGAGSSPSTQSSGSAESGPCALGGRTDDLFATPRTGLGLSHDRDWLAEQAFDRERTQLGPGPALEDQLSDRVAGCRRERDAEAAVPSCGVKPSMTGKRADDRKPVGRIRT